MSVIESRVETRPETGRREASRAVGSVRPRVDGGPKLRGEAEYAGDLHVGGLLHGRPVLSPYAHARILEIDASAALGVPGVRAVLCAADLPVKAGGRRANEPLARSEVVFAGQPVALVVAESEAAAEDGAELVVVEYEPLEAVVDPVAAIAPDASLAVLDRPVSAESDAEMHGTVGAGATVGHEEVSANVAERNRFTNGDVAAAFERCAAVAEGTFHTSWVHQTSLEPQVAVAWPDARGGLTVHTSTQAPFFVRSLLAGVLGLPLERIRVEGATIGGGFGGKIGLIEPLVAAAALAVGRPLRVAFTRTEEFSAANPSPAIRYDVKIGAAADGRLAALEARVVVDVGAFLESGPASTAGSRLGGPYRWEAWETNTYGVRTNRAGAGAYRGPSATQGAFAVEQLLDELAEELDIDPLALRRANLAAEGDVRLDGTPWPRLGAGEVLETARNHPLWRRRDELPPGEGVGLALGLFPGARMGASARCRFDPDGGFTVVTGYVDMTGTDTAMAQIAADAIGVDADAVRVVMDDTASAPPSGVSGGSMVTYCLGSAVVAAATAARAQIVQLAALELEADESDLAIAGGVVFPVGGGPERGLPLIKLAQKLSGFASPYPPVEGHGNAVPPELAPSAAVAIVRVRVDFDTGRVDVLEWTAIQDAGRAINPALCEGQMRGGAVQSLGFALFEELTVGEEGELLSASFLNYALPRSDRVPPIECVIVEVPSPHGPVGAKGIGESAVVPGAAAIANGIARAAGVRLRRMPMTPRRVWDALAAPAASPAA